MSIILYMASNIFDRNKKNPYDIKKHPIKRHKNEYNTVHDIQYL